MRRPIAATAAGDAPTGAREDGLGGRETLRRSRFRAGFLRNPYRSASVASARASASGSAGPSART